MSKRLFSLLTFFLLLIAPAWGEEKLAFTQKTLTVYAGEPAQLPLNRTEGVTYVSSNGSIARVEEGLLVPLKKGTVTVTASVRNEKGTVERASLRVTVKQRVTHLEAPETPIYLPVGRKLKLDVVAMPRNASDRGLVYTCSDEQIATVSKQGTLTAKALGECTVTVTSRMENAVTLPLPIVVVKPVSSIKIDVPRSTTLWAGETYQLTPQVGPEDATHPRILYTSKSEKVATVDENGLITATGRGTAVITLTAADNSGVKAVCRLQVKQPPTAISLNKETATLQPGRSVTLKARIQPATANSTRVEWLSSDETVATVNSKGRVTAKGVGSCLITCRSKDFSQVTAQCLIQVRIPMTKLSLTQKQVTLAPGEAFLPQFHFEPANATALTPVWTSGNPGIARADETGRILALNPGHTLLTVTHPENPKLKDTLTVSVIPQGTALTLKPSALTLKAGDTARLISTLEPRFAQGQRQWSVSPQGICTLSPAGKDCLITAAGSGTCLITVTVDGLSAQCAVTVP